MIKFIKSKIGEINTSMKNIRVWKPFHFEGNLAWGLVDSLSEWERIKIAYGNDTEKLSRARRLNRELIRTTVDNYGFYSEYNGEKTLGEFFTKNNMIM